MFSIIDTRISSNIQYVMKIRVGIENYFNVFNPSVYYIRIYNNLYKENHKFKLPV